jgi:hypothetical protein
LIAGYLVEWFGLMPTIIALGIGSIMVTTSMFLIPALKLMEQPGLGPANTEDTVHFQQLETSTASAKR